MNGILFVCTGNTCRSPMAEFLFKDILKKRGITDVKVASAGISVEAGDKINDKAKAVLKKNGIKSRGFKSKNITREDLENFDLILCMTQNHKNALPKSEKIKTLGEVVDMPDVGDPYGGSEAVYNLCFQQLKSETEKLADLLFPSKTDKND